MYYLIPYDSTAECHMCGASAKVILEVKMQGDGLMDICERCIDRLKMAFDEYNKRGS